MRFICKHALLVSFSIKSVTCDKCDCMLHDKKSATHQFIGVLRYFKTDIRAKAYAVHMHIQENITSVLKILLAQTS